MARIRALEPPFTPDVEAQLATMMPAGLPPIGLFRTFAKNLPMTIAMSHWGRYELGRDLTLTLREREIVILRTCARCGCEYEWGAHLMVFADRAERTDGMAVGTRPFPLLIMNGSAASCTRCNWVDDAMSQLVASVSP
jgi:hypothetical protein